MSLRRELHIRRAAEYFWQTLRCLEMWSNTVLSVWYFLSIETENKKKEEKQNRKNPWDQTFKRHHGHDFPLFKLDELFMRLKKTKHPSDIRLEFF